MTFASLGVDSLLAAQLATGIEARTGIKIDPDWLREHPTVRLPRPTSRRALTSEINSSRREPRPHGT
jgi:hypothetical protein